MSLSDVDKASVVRFLGYPGLVIVPGSTDYNGILSSRLTAMSAEMETQVSELLASIASVRLKLEKAQSRALVEKVGDIAINKDEIPTLRGELARYVKELATLTGIPVTRTGRNVSIIV